MERIPVEVQTRFVQTLTETAIILSFSRTPGIANLDFSCYCITTTPSSQKCDGFILWSGIFVVECQEQTGMFFARHQPGNQHPDLVLVVWHIQCWLLFYCRSRKKKKFESGFKPFDLFKSKLAAILKSHHMFVFIDGARPKSKIAMFSRKVKVHKLLTTFNTYPVDLLHYWDSVIILRIFSDIKGLYITSRNLYSHDRSRTPCRKLLLT